MRQMPSGIRTPGSILQMEGNPMPQVRVHPDSKKILRFCLFQQQSLRRERPSLYQQSKVLRPMRHRGSPFSLMNLFPRSFHLPRTFLVGVSILCLLWVVGCDRLGISSNPNSTVENHLARAKKLYEQRDYEGSIVAYEEILRIRPKDSNSHFQIAIIYDRNLNDFLNACYHYQLYLQCPNLESGRVELVKGALSNARLQFAASVPNAGGQNSPELVKLRTENAALHRQVEELKKELVHIRLKNQPASIPIKSTPPSPQLITKTPPPSSLSIPTLTPKVDPKPMPTPTFIPKNYIVQKGEGIQAIAEKIYHDRRRWRDILQANPNIKDPNQLKPGQVLVLPP